MGVRVRVPTCCCMDADPLPRSLGLPWPPIPGPAMRAPRACMRSNAMESNSILFRLLLKFTNFRILDHVSDNHSEYDV